MEKIDIVLLWVDGNDKKWKNEKEKYQNNIDVSLNSRYRDWDNLQYIFRGIEKNAPWINNIFFITYGHLPKWLNTNNKKLKIIKHEDFIPKKYLPTFNSNVIELNLWRIDELSEQFILLNDDVFIIKKTRPSDFFNHNKPVDLKIYNTITPDGNNSKFIHSVLNDVDIINKNFNKNNNKIFSLHNGHYNIRNLLLYSWKKYTGFYDFHANSNHLKSTFKKVWEFEGNRLDTACCNKFRNYSDLSQRLMRYWNLVENNYSNKRNIYFSKNIEANYENELLIKKVIKKKKCKVLCLNDTEQISDFEKSKNVINLILQELYPNKSNFEIGDKK